MSEEPSELLAARRAKLERLRAAGVEPFPHAFPGVVPIAEVQAAHAELPAGEDTDARYRVACTPAAARARWPSWTSTTAPVASSCRRA